MQKILISVLVCIIYFSSNNCIANEIRFTKLENELLNYVMYALQSTAAVGINNNLDLELFQAVGELNGISSLA